MGLQTTGTLIGTAATALTSSYAALGNLPIGGSKGMLLMVEWTSGSGGTTRALDIKAEFAYDDAGTTYFQESYDVLGSGVNTITNKEHRIGTAIAASTLTKKLVAIRSQGRNAKISVKETLDGGGNAGTITIRAVFVEDEDMMNQYLPTISVSLDEFPAAAAVSSDTNAAPTTTSVYGYNMVYDHVADTWRREQGGVAHDTALGTITNIRPNGILGGRATDPTSLPTNVAAGDMVVAAFGLAGQFLTYEVALGAGEFLAEGSVGVVATVRMPVTTSTFARSYDISAAAEASSVTKASAGNLYDVMATNSSGSARYWQAFKSATVPADTAVPNISIYVAAGGSIHESWPEGKYSTVGWAWAWSSTGATKTLGGSDGIAEIEYL